MSIPTKTKAWILAKQPTGPVQLDGPDAHFKLEERDVPELKDGEVLIKLLYLSNDPAQRTWISGDIDPKRLYVPPVNQGDVMRAGSIAEVLESKDPKVEKGKLVQCYAGWQQYKVVPAKDVNPIQDLGGMSPTHFLGAFGLTGLTAYYGLTQVIEAQKGESIVVSGAAGATGSMVVQLAKHVVGCKKVIGLAGTDEKCRWVESLGADICINYKSSDWKSQLASATSDFVEMYFDNVGGEQLDFMLTRLKMHGRVAACGAIAGYDGTAPEGLKNHFDIISQRLQIRGFIVIDWVAKGKAPETVKLLVDAMKEGKVKVDEKSETVVETKFEDIPKTWIKLFQGGNQGKLVTKLV